MSEKQLLLSTRNDATNPYHVTQSELDFIYSDLFGSATMLISGGMPATFYPANSLSSSTAQLDHVDVTRCASLITEFEKRPEGLYGLVTPDDTPLGRSLRHWQHVSPHRLGVSARLIQVEPARIGSRRFSLVTIDIMPNPVPPQRVIHLADVATIAPSPDEEEVK